MSERLAIGTEEKYKENALAHGEDWWLRDMGDDGYRLVITNDGGIYRMNLNAEKALGVLSEFVV